MPQAEKDLLLGILAVVVMTTLYGEHHFKPRTAAAIVVSASVAIWLLLR